MFTWAYEYDTYDGRLITRSGKVETYDEALGEILMQKLVYKYSSARNFRIIEEVVHEVL